MSSQLSIHYSTAMCVLFISYYASILICHCLSCASPLFALIESLFSLPELGDDYKPFVLLFLLISLSFLAPFSGWLSAYFFTCAIYFFNNFLCFCILFFDLIFYCISFFFLFLFIFTFSLSFVLSCLSLHQCLFH